ncbi:MAG TPA: helix-turn-helix domain-containing protein, partial [Flavisolibacter sp.]|nr:helix-turn-helix domain-containing protein [Flavisolibacter sp.]
RIAYNSLRKKVADALLSVCRNYKNGGEGEECLIHLSRENLAAVAGTAPESLTRTLTDFKAEKLIDIQEGKIKLLQKDKLQKMVN